MSFSCVNLNHQVLLPIFTPMTPLPTTKQKRILKFMKNEQDFCDFINPIKNEYEEKTRRRKKPEDWSTSHVF